MGTGTFIQARLSPPAADGAWARAIGAALDHGATGARDSANAHVGAAGIASRRRVVVGPDDAAGTLVTIPLLGTVVDAGEVEARVGVSWTGRLGGLGGARDDNAGNKEQEKKN